MSVSWVVRPLVGVLAGVPLGALGLLFAVAVWPALLVPAARAGADRALTRLLALERARLARWMGHTAPGRGGGPGFLAAMGLLAVLGGYLCLNGLLLGGLFLLGGLWELTWGGPEPVHLSWPGVNVVTHSGVLGLLAGAAAVAASAGGALLLGAAQRRLADRMLGPSGEQLMRRRIAQLTATRSGMLQAVDDERRRIERDLHDGVQQRGVALAMLLGRARHAADPSLSGELVAMAYVESRRLLDELRSVAWRIYPVVLDELGLRAALTGIAEQSGTPVTVHYRLERRLPSEAETALYFVAREAVTNAVKHAGAHDILIVVSRDEHTVRIAVSDDGRGGADPAGGGLSGLSRRVLALDGVLTVDSPPGGPTTVAAELPCG
ncbi:sensor histidine kinase [Nonomuraea longicatena]